MHQEFKVYHQDARPVRLRCQITFRNKSIAFNNNDKKNRFGRLNLPTNDKQKEPHLNGLALASDQRRKWLKVAQDRAKKSLALFFLSRF